MIDEGVKRRIVASLADDLRDAVASIRLADDFSDGQIYSMTGIPFKGARLAPPPIIQSGAKHAAIEEETSLDPDPDPPTQAAYTGFDNHAPYAIDDMYLPTAQSGHLKDIQYDDPEVRPLGDKSVLPAKSNSDIAIVVEANTSLESSMIGMVMATQEPEKSVSPPVSQAIIRIVASLADDLCDAVVSIRLAVDFRDG